MAEQPSSGPMPLPLGLLLQCLIHAGPSIVRVPESAERQPSALHPLEESLLAGSMGVVRQPLSRNPGVFGCVVQEEHQAGHASSGGGVEPQFDAGNLRTISQRRAVATAEEAHVEVACLNP